jgi:hypothetical protein
MRQQWATLVVQPFEKTLFYCWMPTVWNSHLERKTLNHFVSPSSIELVLTTADTMDPITKGLLFVAGWTAVQVLCFDAGGVVSGILFGGVIPGAALAAAATLGSTITFTMA